ncbi:MAG: hypothetical protein COX80_04465 [Candidatus Magasanikbacteria bacterium CG_4_10_14_0_2_um_filter_33_14]|uniref:N-acetyltransferase domain-containing protein n=1 Tax=Candidatus Magasanikbacteria bacterium CG_4_10_14_0_2_um_filter_33_14 TaxID=1974636 RepID=A0A2M7V9D8_9BACT|nr:MAG: hypothetical protein COX80_04465 [Candidatus Magasanikbacteria bacterium CG_4_10_14_0_2_um_filter_33_14]
MKWKIGSLEIHTRPCQKSDKDFVLGLIKKTLFSYVAKYYKPSVKMFDDRFAKDYKERKILLRGKRRIGFFQLKKVNKKLIINGLFLSPNYQGKGIGKFIMTYFEKFAHKNKLKNIELQVWDNNPAKDFYKKNGYKIVLRKNHKYTMSKEIK